MPSQLSDYLLTLPLAEAELALLQFNRTGTICLSSALRVHAYLVLSGSVEIITEQEQQQLGAGDFAMVARGVLHCLRADGAPGNGNRPAEPGPKIVSRDDRLGRQPIGGGPEQALVLGGEIGAASRFLRTEGAGMPPLIRAEGLSLQLPHLALHSTKPSLAASFASAGGRAVAVSLINLLYTHTVRSFYEVSASPGPFAGHLRERHLGVEAALRLVLRDPGIDWSVKRLAEAVGMSRASFAAAFSRTLGVTPMAYVAQVRLDRARKLIESGTPQGIGELARQVGYRSHSAFTRAYRQLYGRTPRGKHQD